MSRMLQLLADAGAIPANMIREVSRWSPSLQLAPVVVPTTPLPPEEAVARIAEEIEGRAPTEVRVSELDVRQAFESTATEGSLYLSSPGEESIEFPVTVGRAQSGEYLFPWRGEDLEDVMTNPGTVLTVGGLRVHFAEVRDIYEGEDKVFMAARPRPTAPDPLSIEELRRADP